MAVNGCQSQRGPATPAVATGCFGGWELELLDVGAIPVHPRTIFPRPLPARDCVSLPVNALLLKRADMTVLIDTGPGILAQYWPGARATPVAELRHSLADGVELIVLTHLDFDHVGGLFVGRWPDEVEPAFPNAEVVVLRGTCRAALTGYPPSPRNVSTQVVDLLRSRGVLREIDEGAEAAPMVQMRPAPGHRPKHACIEVGGGSDVLLHLADALHHPLHVSQPELDRVSDSDPFAALATRRRLVKEAADRNAAVVASHIPGPSPGRIVRTGDGELRWSA